VVLAARGIALALHGKRALGPRALSVAAIPTSILMNRGRNELAHCGIWVMLSVAYAVASVLVSGRGSARG
jgi:hypothetical protein